MLGYVLTIISGLLIIIPFNNLNLYFLTWIAFVPLFFALKGSDLKESFKKGWLLGIIIFAGTGYWLFFPLNDFTNFPVILIIILLALCFILFGAIYGFWSWLLLFVNGHGKFHIFLLSLTWTGVEYLRFKLFSFYPFGFLAYTQTNFKYLIQLADTGGIFLISFLLILFNGYIYKFLREKQFKFIIPVIILIILVMGTGYNKINYYSQKDYSTLKAGVINTSIPQKEKWLPSMIENNLKHLSESARNFSDPELIITPETSLTFNFVKNGYYREMFYREMADLAAYIQVGSQATGDIKESKLNSVFLISPTGKIVDRYNKLRLVPGEKIPYPNFVEQISGYDSDLLVAGEEVTLFKAPFASWGNLICSEVLYPLYLSDKIDNIDFLINQSNEAWFKDGNLHQQMWSAAVFRAVENRRSLVRSGNHTINGLILPTGISERQYTGGKDFKATVKICREPTFYNKWGNFMGYISLIIAGLLFIIKLIRS